MSNLKKQIAAIRQQLAVSTAETVARLKRHEDRIDGVSEAIEGLLKSMGELKVDQVDMRLALEAQAKAQESAMDQLLKLVADHEERLEQPPAA